MWRHAVSRSHTVTGPAGLWSTCYTKSKNKAINLLQVFLSLSPGRKEASVQLWFFSPLSQYIEGAVLSDWLVLAGRLIGWQTGPVKDTSSFMPCHKERETKSPTSTLLGLYVCVYMWIQGNFFLNYLSLLIYNCSQEKMPISICRGDEVKGSGMLTKSYLILSLGLIACTTYKIKSLRMDSTDIECKAD